MRTLILAALALLAAAFGSFALYSDGSAADASVEVNNFYFCDDADSGQVCETDISAGDTVTWSVEGGSHTVTQCADASFAACPPSGGFDAGTLSAGATFSQTFNTAGTFFYHCDFHPSQMMGKIVVSAAATDTPTAAPTSPGSSATATAKPASVISTGGPPSDDGANVWAYVLFAFAGILVGGSAASYALARRNN